MRGGLFVPQPLSFLDIPAIHLKRDKKSSFEFALLRQPGYSFSLKAKTYKFRGINL